MQLIFFGLAETNKQLDKSTKEKEIPSTSKTNILLQSLFSHCDPNISNNKTDDSGKFSLS